MRVGYTRPKSYKLTPSRKHIGKALARRSKKALALECMKNEGVKKYILQLVGKIVHTEMKEFCSERGDSVLQNRDPTLLKTFTWKTVKRETTTHAPVLVKILESTGIKGKNRPNFDAVVSVCVALLARNRNPRMNLVSKVLSLILYAGHSAKEVL